MNRAAGGAGAGGIGGVRRAGHGPRDWARMPPAWGRFRGEGESGGAPVARGGVGPVREC